MCLRSGGYAHRCTEQQKEWFADGGKEIWAEPAPSIHQPSPDRAWAPGGDGTGALVLLPACVGYGRKQPRLCVGKGCAL